MSSLITNATIQIRQDTAGNWTSTNPTPASGEWCKEIDTGKTKNGDGSTAWNDLIYSNAPPIGAQYIQYAVSDSNDTAVSLPTSEAPTALFGGTWEKLWETESVFFRTEGTLTDTDRADGLQLDAGQKITGLRAVGGSTGYPASIDSTLSGVFSRPTSPTYGSVVANIANTGYPLKFDSADSVSPNVAKTNDVETIVKNRLMRIWRRTA